MASEFTPAQMPTGRRTVGDSEEIADGKGGWIPVRLVKPQHLLEDELVRKIMGYMIAASEQIARLKAHTADDIGDFEALLAQEYGATVGGAKGNKTLTTHDGLFRISVQVADNVVFGPELQVAKGLVDECLNDWASGARDELRAVVNSAFRVDKEGQVNRRQIYQLLRLDIEDDRWKRAMGAIRDAMRVVGSKTYIRAYQRATFDGTWVPVTVDLAKA